MSDLYSDLGVDKDASREDIKKAYRKKASETHPDRGGDENEFKKVNHAYMVLYDPVKREKYDSTGQEYETPFDKRFVDFVLQALIPAIEKTEGLEFINISEKMQEATMEFVSKGRDKVEESKEILSKLNIVKERMIKKNDGEKDLFTIAIDGKIRNWEQVIASLEDEIDFLVKCSEVLSGYEYNVDEGEFSLSSRRGKKKYNNSLFDQMKEEFPHLF